MSTSNKMSEQILSKKVVDFVLELAEFVTDKFLILQTKRNFFQQVC